MGHQMTYRRAAEIQKEHLEWYGAMLHDEHAAGQLRARIAARTKPCPRDKSIDDLQPVTIINQLVPRGGDIEAEYHRLGGYNAGRYD